MWERPLSRPLASETELWLDITVVSEIVGGIRFHAADDGPSSPSRTSRTNGRRRKLDDGVDDLLILEQRQRSS